MQTLNISLCLNDKRVHFERAIVFSIVSWWAGCEQSANVICGWPILSAVHDRCAALVQECLAHSWMQFWAFSNHMLPLPLSFQSFWKPKCFDDVSCFISIADDQFESHDIVDMTYFQEHDHVFLISPLNSPANDVCVCWIKGQLQAPMFGSRSNGRPIWLAERSKHWNVQHVGIQCLRAAWPDWWHTFSDIGW